MFPINGGECLFGNVTYIRSLIMCVGGVVNDGDFEELRRENNLGCAMGLKR